MQTQLPSYLEGQLYDILSSCYQIFMTIGFVSSIFALSQSTIVLMYGPSFALKGDTETVVMKASEEMKQQQLFVTVLIFISIFALFLGLSIFSWVTFQTGCAGLTCALYIVGFWFIAHHSYISYTKGGDNKDWLHSSLADQEREAEERKQLIEKVEHLNKLVKSKIRGKLWRRSAIHQGGKFSPVEVFLHSGKLDFYTFTSSESSPLHELNPINKKPIKSWQYKVEKDTTKFGGTVATLRGAIQSLVVGQEGQDFALSDLMSSSVDLRYAFSHFRFALIPVVSSELEVIETIELMAESVEEFDQWTNVLEVVIKAHEDLDSIPTLAEIASGEKEVTVASAVAAANL